MIIPLGGLVIGALLGVFTAKRRGGNRLDMIQWGVVGALVLGLLAVFALIAIDRSMV